MFFNYSLALDRFSELLDRLRGGHLSFSPGLAEACQKHNAHMAFQQKLDHSSGQCSGECVALISAKSWSPADVVFELWSNSSKHRAIMLKPATVFGLAFYVSRELIYVTFRV